MIKSIFFVFFAAVLSANVYAHEAFKLVSSEKKSIKLTELNELEKTATAANASGANLTFNSKEIRLVVITGPEDDMLSYRIRGLRNPNLVVPPGATLRILFANVDLDMRHDVRFGHVTGEFAIGPEIVSTAGSNKLLGHVGRETVDAEEIVLQATANGSYKYFCSVRGHAKGGMWGNIFVGVKPGANV
ncbi:MAG TPA: sulfocyanin-like copper-binding protein, partial [Pyrinomonadaceae bacterium]|nr:sulfocyanin-like copper-binding protein [Pyrinomonadaceae bacterium]